MASIFRRAWAVSQTWLETRRKHRSLEIPLGSVDFGDLRRTTPISDVVGWDRGDPIDRYFIERFLREHREDIRGHVLEVSDPAYTRKFGREAVTKSDVIHLTGESPHTTIVADLTHADDIADDTFDCIILTQTLQFIFEIEAAISELHRILKPGGVLLATSNGISQISRNDMDRWGDYWRFTSASMTRLFEPAFGRGNFEVQTAGNPLVVTAFMYGLAVSELTRAELDFNDEDYQFVISVRAVKAAR
jgi:SAM-dependent methyltransferase